MGLTLSAGIRLFLCQVISDQAMPFKAKVPNAKTCAAIKAAHKGKVESVTIDQLRRDCHDATCGK
jgi:DNA-damage-inducible protein J